MLAFKAGLPESVPLLRDAIAEIEHSIHHLERSNKEIEAVLKDAVDAELSAALRENFEALNVKRQRITMIKERIVELGGGDCCAAPASALGKRDDAVPPAMPRADDGGVYV